MKKVVSIILAILMIVLVGIYAMADITDWQCDVSEGSTLSENTEGLPVMTGIVGGGLSALYNNSVSFDGFTAEVIIDRSTTGWFGIGFKDAAKGIGGVDVATFGNGVFIICQNLGNGLLTAIPYSVDANGFAVAGCTLGVVSNASFATEGTVKIEINTDETLGYIISINDVDLTTSGGAPIDLNFLKAFFTDDMGYFAVGDLSTDAISSLEIKSITLANNTSSEAASSEATSSEATSSETTSSEATSSETTSSEDTSSEAASSEVTSDINSSAASSEGNTDTADNMSFILTTMFIGLAAAFVIIKARKIKN